MDKAEWHEASAVVGIYRGLHTRPSTYLAGFCSKYPHDIRLLYDGREADAKTVVGILSLGVAPGGEVRIMISRDHPRYEEVASGIATVLEDPHEDLRFEKPPGRARLGVIGIGDYAVKRFLSQLKGHPRVEISAVASRGTPLEKKPYLDQLGLGEGQYFSLSNGQVPEEFFAGLDMVYIASPPWLHLPQTAASVRKRLFTITEKPLVPIREEFRELQQLGQDPALYRLISPADHYLYKPVSRYARQHAAEILGEGRIKRVAATLFEGKGKDNLLDYRRKDWLLTPEAGGGVMMDTGIHLAAVLSKIFHLEFLSCEDAELFDLYPDENFPCESGCYARFKAREPEGGTVPVTIRVAKGTQQTRKALLLETEGGILEMDFEASTIKARGSIYPVEAGGNEHLSLLEESLAGFQGRHPSYTLDDAGKSLGPVWMVYERSGGVKNLKLNGNEEEIRNFEEAG